MRHSRRGWSGNCGASHAPSVESPQFPVNHYGAAFSTPGTFTFTMQLTDFYGKSQYRSESRPQPAMAIP